MKNTIKDQKSASITFVVIAVVVVALALGIGEIVMLMAFSAPLVIIMAGEGGWGQFVKFMSYLFFAAVVSGVYMVSKAFGALGALAGKSNIESELSVNPVLLVLGVIFCLWCYFVAIERFFDASISFKALKTKELNA